MSTVQTQHRRPDDLMAATRDYQDEDASETRAHKGYARAFYSDYGICNRRH